MMRVYLGLENLIVCLGFLYFILYRENVFRLSGERGLGISRI